jgi:two-component system sensor kinase
MGQLIASLLAFCRIARTELQKSSVVPNEIVTQTWQQLEPETAGRRIQFSVATLPTVQADPTLMGLLFYNLLSNAIKYTRQRSPAVIEIGFQPAEAGETVFYVRDNGVGFDMKYVKKLFGLFERLHTLDEFEGTGVGLSTVQRIAQRHGGRVWAEGAVDRGATFYFSLPA